MSRFLKSSIAACCLIVPLAAVVNAQPYSIDHFLLYKTTTPSGGPKFTAVTSIELIDQFEDLGFTAKKLEGLGVPTDKNSEGILDASTHLTAYKITADKGQPRHTPRKVQVTNQFGTVVLDTKLAKRLLVPASKGLMGPLPAPDFDSHAVDHYKCHKAKVEKGSTFSRITGVSVVDQFQSKTIDILKPAFICNPAEKRYGTETNLVKNPNDHLLCYKIRPSNGQPRHTPVTVHLTDQFGSRTQQTVKEREFCVPSSKVVIGGPPPNTHTISPTYTVTATPTPGAPTSTATDAPTPTATPFCGDGNLDAGEQCDPPNPLDPDCDSQICSPTCQIVIITATCGDGCLRPQDGEQCEPPGSTTCPGMAMCSAQCKCPAPPFVVDSFFDVFYRIDLAGCPAPTAPQQHVSGPGHVKQGAQTNPGDGRFEAPIEIVGMSLTGGGVTLGELPGGSLPTDPPCMAGSGCSGGLVKQQVAGNDNPSDAPAVLWPVLVQGMQTLVAPDPIPLQGVVNGYPLTSGTLAGTMCRVLEEQSNPGVPAAYIEIDLFQIMP